MATNETERLSGLLPIWSRPVAIGAAVLFFLSWIFPVTAGVSKDTESFSKWWGRLDVGLAFVLVILTFVIMGIAQGKVDKQAEEASYRGYRILLHGILVMCVVFFVFGDRVTWTNCLTGFAWRTWLLLYALPAWLTTSRIVPQSQIRH